MYIALRRFLHIEAISRQREAQHCTLHAFEQFGALYMHNHNDKYPVRPGFEPGFEPGTSRLQDPVDTNEPSGPASEWRRNKIGVWSREIPVCVCLAQHSY